MDSAKIFKNAQDLPESTVQLNVTTGLLQQLTKMGCNPIAIGPSTTTEQSVGFDVAIQDKTTAFIYFIIQYKAAKPNVSGNILTFELDNVIQNQLMLNLDKDHLVNSSSKTKVYYALPIFATVKELIEYSGFMNENLPSKVGWFHPTEIIWSSNGSAIVTYDRKSGYWSNTEIDINTINVFNPHR